ncbi:hypothetical protein SEA_ZOOMAN_153 [Microbacterium phage Zooman]|nr:hypothetical protein SEA_ZOOMAN_153 [Microbacterium phage Zooman]
MGMYTEFFFRAELKKDTPQEVIDFLDAWFKGEEPAPLDHDFFRRPRWESLLLGSSAYFPTLPNSSFANVWGYWELGIHASLKNYGAEIDYFLDWIEPYVDGYKGDFLGYSLYEESEQPHLYWKRS